MKFLRTLSSLTALLAFSVMAHADPLAVGAAAPAASGVDQNGKEVNFKDVYAKGTTLVYFFPKADTPGCTKQACSIRDNWRELQAKGIQVLGVSEDTKDDEKKFEEKYTLPFTLIGDHDGKVAAAFGVKMLRATITARQSFLIKDGKVVWNMLDKTTTETHAQDVLKAYEALPKS
jgi:peroxiredoxin Q/BCP